MKNINRAFQHSKNRNNIRSITGESDMADPEATDYSDFDDGRKISDVADLLIIKGLLL